jgi:polar amino acid transport system substrate-binding protein
VHVKSLLLLAAVLSSAPEKAPAPGGTSPRVVTICSDPWMPFAGDGPPDPDEGLVVTLGREALARFGHRVRYVVVPWSRCLADVEAGRWDAVACADPREIPDAIYPVEPVGASGPSLFTVTSSTWTYRGPSSLANVRLGAIRHYAYEDEIDGWIRTHQTDPRHLFLAAGTDPLRRLLGMLVAGRIDVLVENRHVARWAARVHGPGVAAIREAGTAGPAVPIFIAFSRATPDGAELAREFDAGLRALYAQGRVAALLDRYGVEPWPRPAAGGAR